ncbi:MAG: hypothetical protein ACK4JY_06490 [Brevundimonas sp.]|uniref:hypothetical protein n=1 Tax=Brevundimonas sp. TaxID=1871086 RepID=UPI00391BC3D6
MKHLSVTMIATLLMGLAGSAAAQEQQNAEKKAEDRREFAGLDLGVGLSVTFDLGDDERVEEAELINGIVRVTDENDSRARIMLESHFFFTPDHSFLNVAAGDWGIGPFVAVQPGTDEIIEAAALGVMIGFRRPDTGDSFNVGLGLAIDPDTRMLGDGLVADQALPVGETAIRYKEESQLGVVLLTSFTF